VWEGCQGILLGQSIPKSKVFPKGNLSKSCVSMRWSGVRLLGMGFHDIQGLILSHLWVPLLRDSHILFLFLFLKHIFPSPLLAIYFACVSKLKTIRGTKKEMHSPQEPFTPLVSLYGESDLSSIISSYSDEVWFRKMMQLMMMVMLMI
jgi:hypothetical protein